MEQEIIEYKGKQYKVTNPGELIYETKLITKYGRTFNTYRLLDQLQELKPIGNCSKIYLKKTYGLTELDYYIIVVLRGDIEKLPKCTYINPYTGEICNEPAKFKGSLIKYKDKLFCDGCNKHSINAAAQNSQREAYKKGITGLQKADRSSKVWKEKLRQHALKQMEEGNSIFSPDEIRKPGIPKPISSIKISGYNLIAEKLGIEPNTATIEELILIDRENYLRKGEPDDICIYYLAYLENEPKTIKLGVTTDLSARSKKGYHGKEYIKTEILFEGTRVQVSNIEYEVKMKFKDSINLGNEGFSLDIEKEIREFIKELILKI